LSIHLDRLKLLEALKITPLTEAEFIVFKGRDGRVYAKDGETGQVIAEDDRDLGVVLQEVVNRIPDTGSGVIYIKPGRYEMYTGVRIAKAGLAIVGSPVFDNLTSWEGANAPHAYPCTRIVGKTADIKYFDIGWEDPDNPERPMRFAMIGLNMDIPFLLRTQ
jgi:hypothetical protein